MFHDYGTRTLDGSEAPNCFSCSGKVRHERQSSLQGQPDVVVTRVWYSLQRSVDACRVFLLVGLYFATNADHNRSDQVCTPRNMKYAIFDRDHWPQTNPVPCMSIPVTAQCRSYWILVVVLLNTNELGAREQRTSQLHLFCPSRVTKQTQKQKEM